MAVPHGWDAPTAVASCPIIGWSDPAWRAHNRKYDATDPGGSLKVSGRYNRGLDRFPPDETWAALYLGSTYGVCLAEISRHLTPELLPLLNERRFSKLALRLSAVFDYRDEVALNIGDMIDLEEATTPHQLCAWFVQYTGCT